jgi:hypothetical protein
MAFIKVNPPEQNYIESIRDETKKTRDLVHSKSCRNGYNGFLEALKKDEYPCPDCGKMKDPIFDCYNCFVPDKEWFDDQTP